MKNINFYKGFLALLIGAVIIVPGISLAASDYHPELAENLNILFFGDPDGYEEEVTYGSWEGADPVVRTIGATNISRSRVTLQAYYSSGESDYNQNDAPKLYIQYGTDRDMEESTEVVSQYRGSRTTSFQLAGLESDETYYFRAVLIFKDEVGYGDRMSFKTLDDGEPRVTQNIYDDERNLVDKLFYPDPSGNSHYSQSYDSGYHSSQGNSSTYNTYNTYNTTSATTSVKPKTVSAPKKAEPDSKSDFKNQASIFGTSSLGAGFFPNTLVGWLLIIAVITGLIWAIRKLAAK